MEGVRGGPDEHLDDGEVMPSRAELEAQLAGSEADRAAGRTVPVAPVLARIQAAADRVALTRTVTAGVARPPG